MLELLEHLFAVGLTIAGLITAVALLIVWLDRRRP